MPSLPNSPWIRGAPRRGLAAAISRTSERMAASVLGRPGRVRLERWTQRRRRWRCHWSTVSGCTISNAVRHSRHALVSRIQNSRSVGRSWSRAVGAASRRPTGDEEPGSQGQRLPCPRQIRPIDRRSTRSAVSMRNILSRMQRQKQPRGPAACVLAKHRFLPPGQCRRVRARACRSPTRDRPSGAESDRRRCVSPRA
jgi:hypothetical protein